MKLSYRLLVLAFILTNSLFAQVPAITAFTPTVGLAGATVVITGSNFSTTPANNIVRFGAAKATVTAATATSLTVTAPTGATYEPITVEVGILTGYSKNSFMLRQSCPFAVGGTSSFATTLTSFSTRQPFYIALNDFDDDGKVDAAVVSSNQKNVILERNTSTTGLNITFTLDANKSCGNGAKGLAVGDLNGDGKSDVVVLNQTDGTITIWNNTSVSGTLSLGSPTTYSMGVSGGGLAVAIGNLDADGKPDIAVTGGSTSTIMCFGILMQAPGQQ
jgi:hypothetical protein